jgi:hypothetical protein
VLVIAVATCARVAAADPPRAVVVTAPTAWLPADGAVVGTASLDHRFDASDGSIALAYGLGGLAAVEVGEDNDARVAVGGGSLPLAMRLGRAAFRIGTRQNAWFDGQPALVLGVRASFASTRTSGADGAHVAEAYAIASRVIAFATVHAGVVAVDAEANATPRLGTTVRPLVALELTPPQYPKTTLVGDLAWSPLFAPGTAPAIEWVAGWGVRYQALSWGAIELDVRHRQNEGLSASTVMVRVTGALTR